MKRCPQCGREYDLTMSYCLDDGSELLYGPGTPTDEPATAIMSDPSVAAGGPTPLSDETRAHTAILQPLATAISSDSRLGLHKRRLIVPFLLAIVALAG